jgi:putative transcriptional regulator
MNVSNCLSGSLLISQPTSNSNYFSNTVVLVCEHSPHDAWGLVLNKPTMIPINGVLESMSLSTTSLPIQVFNGGPLELHTVNVLHSSDCEFDNTIRITPELSVTSSLDCLELIALGRGPTHHRIMLGFSGWGPNQLDGEMAGMPPWTPEHRWLTIPAPKDLLTRSIPGLWKQCLDESISQDVSKFFV